MLVPAMKDNTFYKYATVEVQLRSAERAKELSDRNLKTKNCPHHYVYGEKNCAC